MHLKTSDKIFIALAAIMLIITAATAVKVKNDKTAEAIKMMAVQDGLEDLDYRAGRSDIYSNEETIQEHDPVSQEYLDRDAAVNAGKRFSRSGETDELFDLGELSGLDDVAEVSELRIVEESIVRPVPFNIIEEVTYDLAPGEKVITASGAEGQEAVTVRVFYDGDLRVSEEVLARDILEPKYDRLILRGAYEGETAGDYAIVDTSSNSASLANNAAIQEPVFAENASGAQAASKEQTEPVSEVQPQADAQAASYEAEEAEADLSAEEEAAAIAEAEAEAEAAAQAEAEAEAEAAAAEAAAQAEAQAQAAAEEAEDAAQAAEVEAAAVENEVISEIPATSSEVSTLGFASTGSGGEKVNYNLNLLVGQGLFTPAGAANYNSFVDNGDGTINVNGVNIAYSSVNSHFTTCYDGIECSKAMGVDPPVNNNTATGVPAQRGLCASNEFPFGTVLFVEDYGFCVVADRHGTSSHPDLVDLCYNGGESTTVGFHTANRNVYVIFIP